MFILSSSLFRDVIITSKLLPSIRTVVSSANKIGTLYGFNTVVVVLPLQVVVLKNEAFLFDSMLCHGVHSFPHWMTR